jgi:hypothetical protein
MKSLSRFEANLLHILRFFLRKAPAAQVLPMLAAGCPQPKCLSRAAVELIQDTLAKGCMLLLAHTDGWRRQRFLRNGQPVEGRLWERTQPAALGLPFSRHSLQFLLFVTAAALPTKPSSPPPVGELVLGDWLLFYNAYAALRTHPVGEGLAKQEAFVRNALCRLAFPGDFAEAEPEAMPDFDPWTVGAGAHIMEALQGELRDRWLDAEAANAGRTAWRGLRAAGQAQDQVLAAFLGAAEAAGRRDLARFVLDAAGNILGGRDRPYAWIESLDLSRERLADRAETYRALLSLPRHLLRLRDWDQQARAVGYFDEEYAASQLWKADWEQARGDDLAHRAQTILKRFEEWH